MDVDRLDKLEQRSLYVIREAYSRYKNCALLWSAGKDSTVMLWIARKAFFGEIPFPVIHIDTTYYLKEIYSFRERYEKKWGLNLIIAKNSKALEKGMGPESKGKAECCEALKTIALKNALGKYCFKALFAGIRGDEYGILAKGESLPQQSMDFLCNSDDMRAALLDFHQSEIKSKDHLRIHPMIFWTINDIWYYIKREKIPVLSLYFTHQGKRYRTIGCEPCCTPVKSGANTIKKILEEYEKARISATNGETGGSEDTYTIQKLKSLGYM